jgi:hypothetical protein
MTGSVQSAGFRRTSLSKKNEKEHFFCHGLSLKTLYSEGSKFELIKHAHVEDFEKGRKSR